MYSYPYPYPHPWSYPYPRFRNAFLTVVEKHKKKKNKKHKQPRYLFSESFLPELEVSSEVKVLRELERKISHLDSSLHGELEAISGHRSSAALNICQCKAKSCREDIGSYQPVRLVLVLLVASNSKFSFVEHSTKGSEVNDQWQWNA